MLTNEADRAEFHSPIEGDVNEQLWVIFIAQQRRCLNPQNTSTLRIPNLADVPIEGIPIMLQRLQHDRGVALGAGTRSLAIERTVNLVGQIAVVVIVEPGISVPSAKLIVRC